MSRRLDGPAGGLDLPDWRLLLIGGLLLSGLVVLLVVVLFAAAPSETIGAVQPDDGGAHVTDGADCRTAPAACGLDANPYSSVPATSGPMWNSPANWGVYSTPQAEGQLIHNIEHGGIVIWYDLELEPEAVAELATYVEAQTSQGVGGRYKFILTPWGGEDDLGSPVVVTAWRTVLQLESADTAAIDAFAREYYGQSPEPAGGPGPPG